MSYNQETLFTNEVKSIQERPMMVKDLPFEEQPKNKLAMYGASSLSNAELLSLLISQGSKQESELRLAEKVLAKYKDLGLPGLVHTSVEELSSIPGMTKAKSSRILAAVELSRRFATAQAKIEVVHAPEDAAHYAMPRFKFEQKEHFAVMLLNTKNHILGLKDVSVGSLSASIVHPREVFQTALRYAAAAIILFHNHPSGDPSPSREDIHVTQRLVKSGTIMDIPVLDHIILGNNHFVSLKEKGMM